jgi:hypothetical protein
MFKAIWYWAISPKSDTVEILLNLLLVVVSVIGLVYMLRSLP